MVDPDIYFEDLAASAEVMTLIISTVAPTVDREATFDILLRAFQDGIDADLAIKVGKMIKRTSRSGSASKH